MTFSRKSSCLALGLICAISSLSTSSLQAQLVGKLKFVNNDTLSGEIVSWTPTQITLKADHLVEPTSVSTAKVVNIDFTHSTSVKQQKNGNITVIKLKNRFNTATQDILVGNFTQIDDKHVTLKTPFAGELKVNRDMIHSMEIESLNDNLYYGPTSLKEWNNTLHTKSWEFKDNALVSSNTAGNIAKDVKLPNLAQIQFEHAWKIDSALSFYFYSDSTKESHPQNYYELYFRHGTVMVRKHNGGTAANLRPQNRNTMTRFKLISELKKKRKAKYNLYLDKEKGIFHVYIDGKFYDTYKDPTPKPKHYGTAIHFSSSHSMPIRVSKLKIANWSGHLNTAADSQKDLELFKQEGQRIILKNGDSIIGKIGAVKDNLIEVKTAFAPIKIPIKGLRSLDFSKSKENSPLMYPEDIKIWLSETTQVIVKPLSIQGTKLKAYHQGFGEVDIDLKHVKGIDLHPYDENRRSKSGSSIDW